MNVLKNIILFLILIISTSFAQQTWFEGNNLNSASLIDSDNGIAVGGGFNTYHRFSTILKTNDSGNQWDIQTKDAALYGVSFADENNGTAVGDFGTVIRTTDGGTTWENQSSGTSSNLYGVFLINPDTGWAVGTNGRILKTVNSGTNWSQQISGTGLPLHAVSFANENYGTVVGANGLIFKTTDGGMNWVNQTSGTNSSLYGVTFADIHNGIAVGSGGAVIRTTDGGNNWVSQSSGTNNHLYDVTYADGIYTAVGHWGIIIRSSDSGNTWDIQTSGTTNKLNGVSFIDANNGTAVGWYGTILRTTNGGNTWINQLFTNNETHHFIYNGIDREFYVFLPSNYMGRGAFPLMFALNGSGGTGYTAQDASRMSSVADTSGFIVVYPNPVGANWNLNSDVGYISALIDSVNSYYNVDLSRVYVCGFSFGGYMSHQLGCQLFNRIAAIAPVAGTIQGSTISNCLSTASPPVFYMHGTLDAVVPYSGVQNTLNFWIERNNANTSIDSVALPDIDTTDGSTIMRYNFRDSSGVARVVFYKVINGGHNWSGTDYVFNGVGAKNMDVNTSQEIWNFVKDFVNKPTSIKDDPLSIPTNFLLSQNYPNPFNPSTNISWQSPVGSWQTLKVYDLMGREVATLVDEFKSAGNYEVNFDASKLSSGTYFYTLQAGDFSQTKKLILIK
jgi:poly(3-hydroxybutyrate) depolymerase